MRLVLRILGTWLVGLGVVMIVVDGTRSLAANAVVVTAFGELWRSIHPASLAGVMEFFETRFFSEVLDQILAALVSFPAFAVIGVPGLVLALLGRRRQPQRFLSTDQI